MTVAIAATIIALSIPPVPRTDCDLIRGTEYLFEEERSFFLEHCLHVPPHDSILYLIRNCESSGDYKAVSPNGLYFGAYQFDLQTWKSVGGEGNPNEASPEEQDLRAKILFEQRGVSPWPHCGVQAL